MLLTISPTGSNRNLCYRGLDQVFGRIQIASAIYSSSWGHIDLIRMKLQNEGTKYASLRNTNPDNASGSETRQVGSVLSKPSRNSFAFFCTCFKQYPIVFSFSCCLFKSSQFCLFRTHTLYMTFLDRSLFFCSATKRVMLSIWFFK